MQNKIRKSTGAAAVMLTAALSPLKTLVPTWLWSVSGNAHCAQCNISALQHLLTSNALLQQLRHRGKQAYRDITGHMAADPGGPPLMTGEVLD